MNLFKPEYCFFLDALESRSNGQTVHPRLIDPYITTYRENDWESTRPPPSMFSSLSTCSTTMTSSNETSESSPQGSPSEREGDESNVFEEVNDTHGERPWITYGNFTWE